MNLTEHISRRRVLSVFLYLAISVNYASVMADTEQEPPTGGAPATLPAPAPTGVATVNGKTISIEKFNALYAAIMRKRFYHGRPPEGQAEAVRKEVVDMLIEDELLAEEAGRRGFKPDETPIKEAAAIMEARYGALPQWQKDRERALSSMREQVGRPDLIEQARKALHEVPQPTPAQVRAYYEQKPELFTEPEKLRLSVIMLKVDPGAPGEDWDNMRKEAQKLYLRLKGGANFAKLARKYSGDKSAENGGDLGYLHGGMLPEGLQNKIAKFEVGVVAEPITVLEGVAIYRLDGRVAPVLREFADVEQRAQELLKRDLEEDAWKENISRLRGDARIEVFVPKADDSDRQE